MACLHGGDEQGHGLLGELLTVCDTLGHRQGGGELGCLTLLFLVDLCPLGLVAGGEEGLLS
jgi:hypothetical protein